jgi:hypothetical protein
MSHFVLGVIIPNSIDINNEFELRNKLDELLEPYNEDRKVPQYKQYFDSDTEERMLAHNSLNKWVENLSSKEIEDIFDELLKMNPDGIKLDYVGGFDGDIWHFKSKNILLEDIKEHFSALTYLSWQHEMFIKNGTLYKKEKNSEKIICEYCDEDIEEYKIEAKKEAIRQNIHNMGKTERENFISNHGGVIFEREDLIDYVEKSYGSESGLDENGLYYMSSYNPDSKWDWWQIGGRWSGLFSQIAPRENINNYRACGECNRSGKMNGQECFVCNGEGVILKKADEWEEKNAENVAEIKIVKEIIAQRGNTFFSLLTPTGEWIEKGSMGWWAIVSYDDAPQKENYPGTEEGERQWLKDYKIFEENKKDEWNKTVLKILNQYPEDYYVVAVDCHI